MKKIALIIVAFLMAQMAMAQQFNLPIWPEKMWPSDYANYNTDVLNCCDYLLNTDPQFNAPKHEECSNFLVRWLSGSPEVKVGLIEGLVDVKKPELMVAYMAGWTRQALTSPESNELLCCNVAVEQMLNYYFAYKDQLGKSKVCEKLLKEQAKGNLAAHIASILVR